jgi:hypothetical protein
VKTVVYVLWDVVFGWVFDLRVKRRLRDLQDDRRDLGY